MRYKIIWAALLCMFIPERAYMYPIDGYEESCIRRLVRLQRILDGELKEPMPIPGALKSIQDITLNLYGQSGSGIEKVPPVDTELQKGLDRIFSGMHPSYSIALMDISPGKPVRYAQRKETLGYQPGSVGKILVVLGMFTELQKIFPASFERRQELLRGKHVRAGKWALTDSHTVPFYDPETGKFFKRTVQEKDVFSLYEWLDHALSVSNNGAASVVWREAILMRIFQECYWELSEEEAEEYFLKTPKAVLSDIAISVVNEPLDKLGISRDEWRLGTFFTKGAGSYIPGKGGSTGSPLGLMKFMLALEKGEVVDPKSSLEIKRLLYMTDRRIRYASAAALKEAAVYFKSGSLYKCKQEEGYSCGKYMGNVDNFMNSVAIIEHPDSTIYMVALMSNVLKKNSANDHYALATQIDKLIRNY